MGMRINTQNCALAVFLACLLSILLARCAEVNITNEENAQSCFSMLDGMK